VVASVEGPHFTQPWQMICILERVLIRCIYWTKLKFLYILNCFQLNFSVCAVVWY